MTSVHYACKGRNGWKEWFILETLHVTGTVMNNNNVPRTATTQYDGNGNLTVVNPGNTLAYNIKNQMKSNGSNTFTYSGASQND